MRLWLVGVGPISGRVRGVVRGGSSSALKGAFAALGQRLLACLNGVKPFVKG